MKDEVLQALSRHRDPEVRQIVSRITAVAAAEDKDLIISDQQSIIRAMGDVITNQTKMLEAVSVKPLPSDPEGAATFRKRLKMTDPEINKTMYDRKFLQSVSQSTRLIVCKSLCDHYAEISKKPTALWVSVVENAGAL